MSIRKFPPRGVEAQLNELGARSPEMRAALAGELRGEAFRDDPVALLDAELDARGVTDATARELARAIFRAARAGRAMKIFVGRLEDAPPGAAVFDPAREYAAFDGRLRKPAETTDGLLPVHAVGDCLRPHLRDGDILWFQVGAPPHDGDFVLTTWTRPALERAYPRKLAAGWVPPPFMTKWFRVVAGRYPVLVCRDGAQPLDGIGIVGVLRRIER